MNARRTAIERINWRSAAERHKRAGESAEARHQFDFASHEFFEASKNFRREGKTRDAEEMRAEERRVLSKITMLSESAADMEAQGRHLTLHALHLARVSENGPNDAAPELDALAAGLYEEAADRYQALAGQAAEAESRRECLSKAASHLQRAGRNLARAAASTHSAAQEEEARDLYWRASRLRNQAMEAQPADARIADATVSAQTMLA